MVTSDAATTPIASETGFWSDVERHVVRYCPEFSPVIVESARGSVLRLTDGREVLDFTSGQMSGILGHSHPAIAGRLTASAASLQHTFSGMLSRPVVELSRRLAASLPEPLEKVLLLSTGAESNEAALRLAKLVTGRDGVVAFDRSWHGLTLGAASATYSLPREQHPTQVPGNYPLPTPDRYRPHPRGIDGGLDWRAQLDAGFSAIDAWSGGDLAACIVEPILSSGGVIVPPPGYLAALRDRCHERGMLLIFDEAQTGLCRTGDMYALEDEGVVPDIVTLSKTLGAGLPLAAVVTSAAIEERAHERGFLFFTTHVSDPLPAAVGNTVLDVLAAGDMAAGARRKGERVEAGQLELRERHPVVGDVRGRGLLRGVEFVRDRETKAPATELGAAVTRRCLELGLHINVVQLPSMGATLRIAPALTTTDEELARGLAILDQAIGECAPDHAR
jgi:2,2-dialkylglycine decarboxylase (pyruvate)